MGNAGERENAGNVISEDNHGQEKQVKEGTEEKDTQYCC